jgi:DegV family protein with EDD domain
MTVNIITDSTSDLGQEVAARFGVKVIPLYVFAGGKDYIDGVNITLPELFQSVQDTGQLPKTSAPTVTDFIKAFREPGDTIYIGISSKVSVTFHNAWMAREQLMQENGKDREIYVIDSLNLSTGLGQLVLKAADLRDQGLPAAEIARQVGEAVSKVRTSFIVENLDYLYKGGRCSALQNIVSSMLHIRPIIAVRSDGTLGVKAKTRGTRMRALQVMIDDFCENLPNIDLTRVFISHTGCLEDAEYMRSKLLEAAPIQEVLITKNGSVIASHCGPDTTGILYLLK